MPDMAAKKKRPVWFDLNLLNLPAPGLLSIFHRVSGALLFLGLVWFLFLLDMSLGSEAGYAHAKAYLAHPAVKLSKVVGVPDPRLVEVVAAYVQRKEGAAATPEELIAWCKERCAGFKVPRYVRFVDSFDSIGMTASSKIQRNKLREYALADLGLSDQRKKA